MKTRVGYSRMSTSAAFVNNFFGLSVADSTNYGYFGWAVTLPRHADLWRATTRRLRGMVQVCRQGASGACIREAWFPDTQASMNSTDTGFRGGHLTL